MLDQQTKKLFEDILRNNPLSSADGDSINEFLDSPQHFKKLAQIMNETEEDLLKEWNSYYEPKLNEIDQSNEKKLEKASAEVAMESSFNTSMIENGLPDSLPTGPSTHTGISSSQKTPNQRLAPPQTQLPFSLNKPSSSLNKPLTQATPAQPKTLNYPHHLSFRFDNGKIGVAYRSALEILTPNAPAIDLVRVDVPSDSGLQFSMATRELSGIPSTDGEIKIDIWYGQKGGGVALKATTLLTINPDPKSLWKNLPSDPKGVYAKPDEDKRAICSQDFLLVGASKRGRSHAHVGSFRDDDFFLCHLEKTGWHLCIVSDGAGSAKYSRRGSELICKEGGARLSNLLSGDDGDKLLDSVIAYQTAMDAGEPTDVLERSLRNELYKTIGYAVHHAAKSLLDEAKSKEDGIPYKDFSSTALFGIVKKFPFGTLCAAYWVGDGAVAALDNDGSVHLLGQADGGEFSGQTRFLTPDMVSQQELFQRIRFAIVPDFKAMVLMTDGVSDPFFETDAGLADPNRWKALWSDINVKTEVDKRLHGIEDRMLEWLDFWSAGNHDDRTLVLIY